MHSDAIKCYCLTASGNGVLFCKLSWILIKKFKTQENASYILTGSLLLEVHAVHLPNIFIVNKFN